MTAFLLDWLWALVPFLAVVWGLVGYYLNRNDETDLSVSSMLTVLSALLAALAILIPLATSLLPAEISFTWPDKLLLSALVLSVVSLFCIVYCIITLPRKGATYKPKSTLNVPIIVNGTWFVLFALASSVVIERSVLRDYVSDSTADNTANGRFSVQRELPVLGTDLDDVLAALGQPSSRGSSAVVYRLASSFVTFCIGIDRKVTQILETEEISDDAIRKYCAAD